MQEWNSSRANSSKLKLYNQVKTELGFELYLTHINVKKLRAAMSRFRCSNYILKIETGRYDGTNEENRYCPLYTKKGLFTQDLNTFNSERYAKEPQKIVSECAI